MMHSIFQTSWSAKIYAKKRLTKDQSLISEAHENGADFESSTYASSDFEHVTKLMKQFGSGHFYIT